MAKFLDEIGLSYFYGKLKSNFNPTGTIIAFAGNTLPKGYLLCDGSKVSRTTYKKLFDVIGTTYGAGDGKTTFTLPNLIGRFLEGSSAAGSYLKAGLPNLTGRIYSRYMTFSQGDLPLIYADGSLFFAKDAPTVDNKGVKVLNASDSNPNMRQISFDASRGSSIYGNSNTVQPSACTIKMLIKY